MGLEVARSTTQIQNSPASISKLLSPTLAWPWPILTGAFILAISLALLPFIERTWRATGDEPHYLLTAHSLVADRDFDLTNNYAQFDYLNFYFSQNITPQVRFSPGGQQILDHQLGLPVLIAPAYALAGRLGVLAFQVIVGALLAGLTFKLSFLVSQDEVAALVATLLVSFSSPLFLYQYLVYPELTGALLTTLVVYVVAKSPRPTWTEAMLVLLALMALPWLNRRFVPLALGLAFLLAWAWSSVRAGEVGLLGVLACGKRKIPSNSTRSITLPPSFGLVGLTLVSILTLFWFNSQFLDPTTSDITAPVTTGMVWERLSRGIGWLVDQQRGLFIYAPILLFALWGAPFLIQDSWQHRNRHGLVLLPLLLSLGVTTVAGGFWVAWEVGPRFLVVALPSLAPLLALAWRNYRRPVVWRMLALLIGGVSLSHTFIIIQYPELPYKSSVPLYYSQKWGLPLTDYLPDLAGYARIFPAVAADIARPDQGEPEWLVEAGHTANLFKAGPVSELPFGHYRLSWSLRTEPNLPPQTELARLALKVSGGGQVFNHTLTAAELPSDGRYGQVQYSFLNTNVDRWRIPLVFSAVSSGAGRLWIKDALFEPQPFYAVWLPYLTLLGLAVAALLAWRFNSSGPSTAPHFKSIRILAGWVPTPGPAVAWEPPLLWFSDRYLAISAWFTGQEQPRLAIATTLIWSLVVILPITGLGWLLNQHLASTRIYDSAGLYHLAGQAVPDSQASTGQAWLVDPKTDPPQKAVYGPFDFYDAGLYRVTFRLKLRDAVTTDQELARLQVAATANFNQLVVQPLRREHFAKPNVYHDFVLTVTNPRRQALSFEVDYLGVAPLLIDQVTITKIEP
jgi:hypothetical protein